MMSTNSKGTKRKELTAEQRQAREREKRRRLDEIGLYISALKKQEMEEERVDCVPVPFDHENGGMCMQSEQVFGRWQEPEFSLNEVKDVLAEHKLVPSIQDGRITHVTMLDSKTAAPAVLLFDAGRYYKDKLCPSCNKKSSEDANIADQYPRERFNGYLEVRKEIMVRFGDRALPVCFLCWHHNCEKCAQCGVPTSVAFSNDFGNKLLEQVTVTPLHKSSDLCVTCAAKN